MLSNAKTSLNRLFIKIFILAVVAFCLGAFVLIREDHKANLQQWQSHAIRESTAATSSYYSLLTTQIIMKNDDAIETLLHRITEAERLLSATIVPRDNLPQDTWTTCSIDHSTPFSYHVPTCHTNAHDALLLYHELRSAGQTLGYLAKETPRPTISLLYDLSSIGFLSLAFLCFTIAMVITLFYLRKYIITPTRRIIQSITLQNSTIDPQSLPILELQLLAASLQDSLKSIANYRMLTKELEYRAELGHIASKVVHDIRGPISSIEAAVCQITKEPNTANSASDISNLLQLSCKRLSGIAQDLLRQYSPPASSTFSMHRILDQLIGEYEGLPSSSDIAFVKHYHSMDIALRGNQYHFQRACANLISNAMESIDRKGTIRITTFQNRDLATLSISDNGSGMSEDTLAKVLERDHTEGKVNGHGIGMRVVKDVVEEFGGSLVGHSTLTQGTTFTVTLPVSADQRTQLVAANRQSRGSIEITVEDNSPVVVIDDDPAIQEQWRTTLGKDSVVTIAVFSYEELTKSGIQDAATSTAIVDFNFDHSHYNGEDVVRFLQLHGFKHITLCSAEYWKPSIESFARSNHLTVCPKPLPHVIINKISKNVCAPLDNQSFANMSVIVIDDDECIRLGWIMEKDTLGITRLETFDSMESCIASEIHYSDFALTVVDKHVCGSSWELSETICYLKERGVSRVLVASGEHIDDLRSDPACAKADGFLREKIPSARNFISHYENSKPI